MPATSTENPVDTIQSLKTSSGKVNLDIFPDGLKSTGNKGLI